MRDAAEDALPGHPAPVGEGGSGTRSKIGAAATVAALLDELWLKVLMDVRQIDLLAFVSTCKQLRRVQVASNRELVIKVKENDFYDTRVELSEWALMQLSAKARTEFAKRRQLISSCAALPGNLKVL